MAHPMGESKEGVLSLDFDRRLKLEPNGIPVNRIPVSASIRFAAQASLTCRALPSG